jgi:sulfate adenylyltransferase subunit 1
VSSATRDAAQENELSHLLQGHLHKDMLRFTTAGSVDDGKSTLIGRLLHDSKAVYEDQLASVRKSRINRSGGPFDFALLTDGLRAEREQGITIDVAYRYFETPLRKFIIADTPGHEQYTRNMATGASTADLAVILLDATRGVLSQTRRHAYISSLLGIPNAVAAINKMDMLEYDEEVFRRLADQFRQLASQLGIPGVVCIPMSALVGDNVVTRSERMPWYSGPTLLEHLERVPGRINVSQQAMRFPVQLVIRPDASFRGFAGQVASGTIRRGDTVLALPSGQTSRVKSLVTGDGVTGGGDVEEVFSPMSVTVTLTDEIDLSRGDMLVAPEKPPFVSKRFEAMVVWFNAQPLALGRNYLLKHTVRTTRAQAVKIAYRIDMKDLDQYPAHELKMNDIGEVEFESAGPLFFDSYDNNHSTGSFILIDPISNATVGAGMIRVDLSAEPPDVPPAEVIAEEMWKAPITPLAREKRHGHEPALIVVEGRTELAEYLESALFAQGFEVLLLSAADVPAGHLETLLKFGRTAGLVVILSAESATTQEKLRWKALVGERFFDLAAQSLPAEDAEAVPVVISLVSALRVETDRDGLVQ